MVHNVLVFGSGYGNCRSLRPNGHDLNKTSQSIVSSFNILPRDHHPKNAKKKKRCRFYSRSGVVYETHTGPKKKSNIKEKPVRCCAYTSSEGKKSYSFVLFVLSDSPIAT